MTLRATAAALLLVLAGAGVAGPALSHDEDIDADVLGAVQVHLDHPVQRGLIWAYTAERVTVPADVYPEHCAAGDPPAVVLTGRSWMWLPVSRVLAGCGGLTTVGGL